jgi:mannose-6-phosphate isomerase-like protein (cupin superfamily)
MQQLWPQWTNGQTAGDSGLVPPTVGGQLTILDYRAAAGFGPPRHLHHRADEVFQVIEGQAVVCTPNLCFVLASGDLVLLPKLSPHTWRAYGPKGVRFTATFTPGGFEHFFQDISGGAFSPLTWTS